MRKCCYLLLLFVTLIGCRSEKKKPVALVISDYASLVTLFKEWRAFENPPLKDGAPDYTAATFEQRMPAFKELQERLLAMDTTHWPIEHKVDWRLVWAEMNGFYYNHLVLQSWNREGRDATVGVSREENISWG